MANANGPAPADAARLLACCRGEAAPDLVIVGGRIADVFTGEIREADVAVLGDRIAAVGDVGRRAGGGARRVDAAGCVLTPGLVSPHDHILLTNPWEWARLVLPFGTTAAVVDSLHLTYALGRRGTLAAMEALAAHPFRFLWSCRVRPPSPVPGEAEEWSRDALAPFWRSPHVVAAGEITDWVDLEHGDAALLEKVSDARAAGKRIEGHVAGASYRRLLAQSAAGVTACHEAVGASEVVDRLRAGLYTMLRHSPIRPDLPRLVQALAPEIVWSNRVMLTPDGVEPAHLARDGHMSCVLAEALRSGVPAAAAVRMATLNPAAYFGVEGEIGSLAPGRRADIAVWRRLGDHAPHVVFAGGREVARDGRLVAETPSWPAPEAPRPASAWRPEASLFHFPAAAEGPLSVPVIRYVNNVITERVERTVRVDEGAARPATGTLLACLLDRGGRWIARGFVEGWGEVPGFATTVSDGPTLLVLGGAPYAMAAAANRALDLGGGMVVAGNGGAIEAEVDLSIGGYFSASPHESVARRVGGVAAALRRHGFPWTDPLYGSMFLTFASLPWIRLTYRGLWDVRHQTVLWPRTELSASR